jgi:alkylation response protein AidB-like acyl-CoA dehydrogenase
VEEPEVAARLVDALLVLLSADACGAGLRAYRMAVEYANVRTQFGQVIGKFQALRHQLANMAVDMEPCRALYWYAAYAWDTIPQKQRRTAATAKAHITDMAVRSARAAVEAHGGIGYTWEYPLHLYLKRAMHSRLHMGSPALHRERMALLARWGE